MDEFQFLTNLIGNCSSLEIAHCVRLIFGQTIDCKTVRIFAYSSTLCARTFKHVEKLKTELETEERRFVRVRLLRCSYSPPIQF